MCELISPTLKIFVATNNGNDATRIDALDVLGIPAAYVIIFPPHLASPCSLEVCSGVRDLSGLKKTEE